MLPLVDVLPTIYLKSIPGSQLLQCLPVVVTVCNHCQISAQINCDYPRFQPTFGINPNKVRKVEETFSVGTAENRRVIITRLFVCIQNAHSGHEGLRC